MIKQLNVRVPWAKTRVSFHSIQSHTAPQYSSLRLLVSDQLAVAQLVEALRYEPEGRGFDSRCDGASGIFH